ncbi:hypothetical protein D3C80_1093210 [compost metagenome]
MDEISSSFISLAAALTVFELAAAYMRSSRALSDNLDSTAGGVATGLAEGRDGMGGTAIFTVGASWAIVV